VFNENNIEAVIHFAANSLVGESVTNPIKYYDNNVYGTLHLIDCMVRHNCLKIVFSSSAAVYGEPQNIPILETDRTMPTNPYGETKLAMENMLKWADKAYGLRFVALRYFNATGAGAADTSVNLFERHNPETHLIPLVLQAAFGQLPNIKIFGDDYDTFDGTCIRDYIHVTDLANAHILALKYLQNDGQSRIFNLGNGVGFSVKQIIEVAKKVTGKPIETIITGRRAGDPAVLVASSQCITNELGWKIKFSNIEDIIESAINI
jgi:UDP-glucose 4-epimerase